MKYLLPLYFIILVSCAMKNNIALQKWEYQKIITKLTQTEVQFEDKKLIEQLIGEYRMVPFEDDYSEVVFSNISISSTGRKYYFFDVKYVDDMQVVFQFDKKGILRHNFLYSSFQ